MKHILIINPFGIGDCLFTTPLIGSLKTAFPGSTIDYWCNQRVAELLRPDKRLSSVIGCSRGDLKKTFGRSWTQGMRQVFSLLRWLRRKRYDAVFDFSLDHRYGFVCKLLKIPRRIGFNYRNRGRFLTDRIDIDGYNDKHVVEYYLDLLRFIGIEPAQKTLSVAFSDAARAKAAILLARATAGNNTIVGIAAGAGESWGKNASLKHWPALRFAQLAQELIDTTGCSIVLLGSPAEVPIADVIRCSMTRRPIDLVGKTTLSELAAVLSRLSVLVTNDGGILHLGVAAGCATVSVFGPVDPAVYGPYPPSGRHRVVSAPLECRPCYRSFKLLRCARERECILSVGVDEIRQQVSALIGENHGTA